MALVFFSPNPVGISTVTKSAEEAIGIDDDVIAALSEPNAIKYAHLLRGPCRCIAKTDAHETEEDEISDIHLGPDEAIGAREEKSSASVSECPAEFISRCFVSASLPSRGGR